MNTAPSPQAAFTLHGRNPDVLTCIANLSNDEVFTPPEFAARMLDTVAAAWAADHAGANIWANPSVRFLDPFTKSGIFLREITQRLTLGLEKEIPDLQQRVNHILTKQVFGIAITELTALLARRSVYCSRHANGQHSIAQSFTSEAGNIWFERTEHTWQAGKCQFCGASQAALERGESLENHAYAFIHTQDIKTRIAELFGEKNMQFDVIIGNPPYQLDDGGHGASAAPIYQKFVEQAKALEPRYLCMIIPARWFAGGKGLDEFREAMLKDDRTRVLHDYLLSSEVFPGVDIRGGVCYFVWEKDKAGDCAVTTHFKDWPLSVATRPLLEKGADVFIRFNEAVPILKKIMAFEHSTAQHSTAQHSTAQHSTAQHSTAQHSTAQHSTAQHSTAQHSTAQHSTAQHSTAQHSTAQHSNYPLALHENKRFDALVSSARAFGLRTFFRGETIQRTHDVLVYQNGSTAYAPRTSITVGVELIDAWKVFISGAYGAGSDPMPSRVLGRPFVGEPGSISTETYLCIGPLNSKIEAESVVSYLSCQLTRFLVLLHKPSQHATRRVYTFVPKQDWSRRWTDADLYAQYGITDSEIAFIEKMVRPMNLHTDLLGDVAVDEGDDE